MLRIVRILGFIVVACAIANIGVLAQDKPAGGQDKQEKKETTADPLSGAWDGSVESPNGAISFTLKIKLEKEKFTGEIASEQGGTAITGTWTEGKFAANFDYNGTPVAMTGTLKDDVLTGEMSFGGGEMVMNWTAKKQAAK